MMKKHTLMALAVSVAVLGGCASVKPEAQKNIGMPNPATVFCLQQGGQSQIVNTPEGQVGYCQFSDGTRVNQWQYFRDHHAADIQKANSLPNPAAQFCVQQGGKSEIVQTNKGWVGYCQFSNGTRVNEWEYFREHHQMKTEQPNVGLANPASVFCVKQGGKSVIEQTPKGWVGYCQFSNGTKVDEWQYFRENHKNNQ